MLIIEHWHGGAAMNRHSGKWLVLAILLAVSWALRCHRLGAISFWFDESMSWKYTTFSISEILERLSGDVHPPLYFVLLKGWAAVFGNSAAELRSLSVLCGVLTVLGSYLFVREAYEPVCEPGQAGDSGRAEYAALTAAALVAFSPMQIEWSMMVRMYALLTTLAVFSAWILMRALRRPGQRRLDWMLFAATAIFMGYTHHVGLFTLTAEFMFASIYVWRYRRSADGTVSTETQRNVPASGAPNGFASPKVVPFLISAWVVATAGSLGIDDFLQQRELVADNFWSSRLDWSSLGSSLGTIFFQLFGVHEWEPSPAFEGLLIAQAAVIGLLLVVVRGRPGDFFVALLASVPFLAAIYISLQGRNILFTRYLITGHLFLLLAGAVLLSRIPLWPLRLFAILLVLGGMSDLSWKYCARRARLARLPGMQAAIARFERARQTGEQLIVCNPMLYTSVFAYSHCRKDCFVNAGWYPHYEGTAVLRDEEYFPRERLADGSCKTVWTLDANQWHGGDRAVAMPVGWKLVGDWRFPEYYCGELVLRLYEHQPSVTKSVYGDGD